MSIIHDALKKSGQGVIGEGRSAGAKSPVQPALERHQKKASVSWGPLFAIAVLLIIAGPVLAPLFSGAGSPTGSGELRTVSAGDGLSGAPARQFAVEEAPLPAKNMFPAISRPAGFGGGFKLSGVVYSGLNEGQDSYCLINGKVLKQGESVGGAVIESISTQQVVLNRDGQRTVLQVVAG